MTGEDLLKELLLVKEKYGTLDVPISIYFRNDRIELAELDVFIQGKRHELHSIDINTK